MTRKTDDVFKIKDGSAEYNSIHDAVAVAKTRAAAEGRPITICRKLLNTYEPVIRLHPDGSKEQVQDDPDHITY